MARDTRSDTASWESPVCLAISDVGTPRPMRSRAMSACADAGMGAWRLDGSGCRAGLDWRVFPSLRGAVRPDRRVTG